MILGGRGAGKTRAGAEWVRSMLEGPRAGAPGPARRMALIGETLEQVRDVMVMGGSGILAVAPEWNRPRWNAGRRMLEWENGATAQIFSALDPEALRGPQFDSAWADELAKWRRGPDTWDMLQFGLRLGERPRACITTTPRNVALLRDLIGRDSTVLTHAATMANAANLAPGFLEDIVGRYGGTRLGRQELDGVLMMEAEGSLWPAALLERCVSRSHGTPGRIVVAVDPPVTGHAGSDECGIIVAGVIAEGPPKDWRAVVLEDASLAGARPLAWAEAAVAAYHRHGADRIVAEVNQGGDLVEEVIRSVDPSVSYRGVRASRGKIIRAEPAAALYEQLRVAHVPGLTALEEQMALVTTQGYMGSGSPDRVDALVWALFDLIIAPSQSHRSPQVRML